MAQRTQPGVILQLEGLPREGVCAVGRREQSFPCPGGGSRPTAPQCFLRPGGRHAEQQERKLTKQGHWAPFELNLIPLNTDVFYLLSSPALYMELD